MSESLYNRSLDGGTEQIFKTNENFVRARDSLATSETSEFKKIQVEIVKSIRREDY